MVSVEYYDKIPTTEKVYNKYFTLDNQWARKFRFLKSKMNQGHNFGDILTPNMMIDPKENFYTNINESNNDKGIFFLIKFWNSR